MTALVAATAGLVATLGLPAAAEGLGGADGVRYVRNTTTMPASSGAATKARADAICPKGWRAIGGGHTIRGGEGRGIAWGSTLSARRWSATAWQVDSAATRLTTYGVCFRTHKLVEEDATEYELPAGPSTITAAAGCPGGRAVSGGVTYFGPHAQDFSLNFGYPVDDDTDTDTIPDDGWRGRVHYTGDGGDNVSVFLVCLTGGERPAYRRSSITVPAGQTVRSTTFCPRGRPVLGGGIRVNGSGAASHVIASRPIDSKDAGTVPDDGWLGGITNTSDQDLRMTVHAICR